MKRPGIEQRIANTAKLLESFIKENIPPEQAEPILKTLSSDKEDTVSNDSEDNEE